jgi:serine protease Do
VPRTLATLTAAPIAAELAALASSLSRVTVRLRTGAGSEGCGILWPGGLVVSNAHVVRGTRARAWLRTGEAVELRLIARDPELDLAALEPASALPAAARLGQADALRAGELVVALGHPLGVANAVALGVVHHLTRDASGRLRWIGADIDLAPGNSGGPLAGVDGRVLGVNTLIAGGLGYAIPAPAVERFLGEAA